MRVRKDFVATRLIRARLLPLLAAIVVVLLAFFLHQALAHGSPGFQPYVTFYPAIVLVALLGDFWAVLLATALSALLADYFILLPIGRLTIGDPADVIGFALFCVSGIAIAAATELYRRSRERLAAYQAEAAVLDERRKMNPAREAADAAEPRLRNNLGRHHGAEPNQGENVFALIRLTVAIPVVALALLAAVFLWQIFSMKSSMQWVDHTDQVISANRRLLNQEINMESGLRGYLNTGAAEFLQPYNNANLSIDSNFDQLWQLISDNPAQQAKLADIRRQFNQWRLYAQSMIELRRSGNAGHDYEINLQGKRLMDSIRDSHHAFTLTEEQLRDQRVRTVEIYTRLVIITSVLFALGVGVFLAVFTQLRMRLIAARFQGLLNLADEREEALRQNRQWLSVTLGSIGDAVLATGNQGRITFLNPVAAALTGWNADEAQGRPAHEVFRIINEKTQEAAEDIFARVLREGHAAELANHTAVVAKNGAVTPVEDNAAPIRNIAGEVIGVVLVFRDVTARRRAHEAQQYLSAIVDSSDDAIVGKSLDGVITSWNLGAARLYGYTAAEMIGKPISMLAPVDRQDETQEFLERVSAGQRVDHYESIRQRKDGSLLDVSLTISPIFDTTGKIVGASTIARDITERKRAERELQSTLQRFFLILSSMYPAVLLVSPDGDIEFVNQAFCDMYNLEAPPADFVGVSQAQFLAKIRNCYLDPEAAMARILAIVGRGEPVAQEEFTMQNGRTFLRDFVPLNVDGQLYGRLWLQRDITERKRAEEELRESEEQFRNLANAIPQLCWMANADGWIFWYNQRWFQYTGTTPEQMEGWGWKSVHDPDALPGVLERWTASIHTGQPFDMVFPLRGADGLFREFLTRVIPIKSPNGKVVRWFGTNTDITDIKRAEMRLRRFYETDLFAILYWKIDGGVVDANDEFLRMFGYSREELRAGLVNWSEMTPPEYSALDEDARRQIRETGVHLPFEKEFIRKDGARVWVIISAAAYDDDRSQGVSFMLDISERKRAEEALQRSEKRYRNLFSAMAEGFCVLEVLFDVDGKPEDYRFLEVNDAFEKQTGLRDAVGKRMRELAPDHEAHWFEIYGKIALTGEPAHFMNQAKALNRFYDVHAYRVGEPEQRRVAVVFNDITDIKRAEAALRHSEKQLQQIIDGAPETMVFLKDLEGRFITINSPLEKMLGVTRDEIRGKTDYDIITRDRADLYRAHDRQVMATGQPILVEETALLADGQEHIFLASKFPLFDADGKPYAVCAISVDITDRRRAEQSIRKSEERLRMQMDRMPIGCIVFDRHNCFNQLNPAAEHILGYTATELRGQHANVIVPETLRPQVESIMRRLAEGDMTAHSVNENLTRNGATILCQWTNTPLRDGAGNFIGFLSMVQDITERKRAEDALLRSEKEAFQRGQLRALAEKTRQVREEERKRVARDLHDDLGQLLTAIKMDLTWTKRHLTGAKGEVQDRLARSIEMVGDGVNSVRRICSGLRPGVLDDLGLPAAIEWEAGEFASRTGIDCEVILPSSDLHVDSEVSTTIFRIFQECLTNVMRHAQARSVRVSLAAEDGNLSLIVQDDGVGFQESNASNPMGSLGILGMKERAQACGGEVIIASSPGNGTTVAIRVPAGAVPAQREGK